MARLIDSIDFETIIRVGEILCVLGFFLMMLGLLIMLCAVMLGDLS